MTKAGNDRDAMSLAGDALAQAIALTCEKILCGDMVDTAVAAIGAIATFVASGARDDVDPEKVADRLSFHMRDSVLRAIQALRLDGMYRREVLEAARTLSLGLPINRKLHEELKNTTILNQDGTVDAETLAALEELHKRADALKLNKTGEPT